MNASTNHAPRSVQVAVLSTPSTTLAEAVLRARVNDERGAPEGPRASVAWNVRVAVARA